MGICMNVSIMILFHFALLLIVFHVCRMKSLQSIFFYISISTFKMKPIFLRKKDIKNLHCAL